MKHPSQRLVPSSLVAAFALAAAGLLVACGSARDRPTTTVTPAGAIVPPQPLPGSQTTTDTRDVGDRPAMPASDATVGVGTTAPK